MMRTVKIVCDLSFAILDRTKSTWNAFTDTTKCWKICFDTGTRHPLHTMVVHLAPYEFRKTVMTNGEAISLLLILPGTVSYEQHQKKTCLFHMQTTYITDQPTHS